MSGIGFTELVVLFVIGLLILGPERLPRVATQIGRWVGRARRTANQLRYQLEREIALADIEKKTRDRDETKRQDSGAAGSTSASSEPESRESPAPTAGADAPQSPDAAGGQSAPAPDQSAPAPDQSAPDDGERPER